MADQPSRKRANVYQKFDGGTKKIRGAVVESLTRDYLDHVDSNGGKARRNFVKNLIAQADRTTTGLNITRDDIKNAARRQRTFVSNTATPSPTNPLAANLSLLADAASLTPTASVLVVELSLIHI